MRAVILAGGKGTRLTPYTSVFPKPLMPIDGVPILQIVLRQLKEAGFEHTTLAVGHMAEMIRTYFGDGTKFGLKIDYSHEEKPLGTVGALSLINELPDQFILINGDILTDFDFTEFFSFHEKSGACATIATYLKEVSIEYGVIKSNDRSVIVEYDEKPSLKYQVSMGIYAFGSRILRYIKKGQYLDFPDLVNKLIMNEEIILEFPFQGYWMDIGCHADYEKAAEDFVKLKHRFFKQPDPGLQLSAERNTLLGPRSSGLAVSRFK